MSTAKELAQDVLKAQPEDASYEEIMRELAFDRMIAKGLEDCRTGQMIENSEMEHRIRQWQG
ncbi:hypothetical protein D5125_01930 [Magnetovirga frankeli]|uniref:hypothetical protein n=1 Tax=Magnetovirga frankeli TaxID=947516 RepID=UPI001293E10D|nr:hypothetical protein D5125_01930 [gamma proteobacterium SS-5]